MAALHKFNPVRLAYIRDQAAARFDRDPRSSTASRACACSISAAAAAFCLEPLARLGAQMIRRRPGRGKYRRRAGARKETGVHRRLPRHHRRGTGGCERALRCRIGHGGGRARHRCELVRCNLCRDGEPSGLMIAATARCKSFALTVSALLLYAGCRAAPMGQVRYACGTGDRDWNRHIGSHWRTWRDL